MKNFFINQFIEEVEKKLPGESISRSNIELFRSKLRDFGALNDRSSLNEKHLKMYLSAHKMKSDKNLTWENVFDIVIDANFQGNDILSQNLKIDASILIEDLIYRLKEGKLEVFTEYSGLDQSTLSVEKQEVFKNKIGEINYYRNLLIQNYVKLGDEEPRFRNSQGTDGSPVLDYLLEAEGYKYIIIGKLNSIGQTEDIHIYFNHSDILHPMNLQFIGYLKPQNKAYTTLRDLLRERSRNCMK